LSKYQHGTVWQYIGPVKRQSRRRDWTTISKEKMGRIRGDVRRKGESTSASHFSHWWSITRSSPHPPGCCCCWMLWRDVKIWRGEVWIKRTDSDYNRPWWSSRATPRLWRLSDDRHRLLSCIM